MINKVNISEEKGLLSMQNILIIEDNLEINNLIKETLEKYNYNCTQAFSGSEGLLQININTYSLIILDLMLPGLTGEEFLKKIKGRDSNPVLVISAKESIDSKIECLELGADDYLVKPFDIKELKARVDALIRRTQIHAKTYDMVYEGITDNKELFDITVEGKSLNLTKQEYEIIKLLMENSNKVFTKQDIYEYAWKEYYMGEDKTINVHISNIRRKIKQITEQEFIETVWGIGFKFKKPK